MWFLSEKVLLTMDNLAKRNWHGCQKCCFCDSLETIEHLFISCPFAKNLWRMIFFTFNITPPTNIANMFSNWLNGVEKKTKARIRVGVTALCWSIWTSRNNIIFNKSGTNFLQVIRLAVHWLDQWSLLLPVDQRESMASGCSKLLTVTQDCYFRVIGWRHNFRIGNG